MIGVTLLALRLILALLLYIFLGWALLTIWKDIHLQSERLGLARLPSLTLQPLQAGEPNLYHFNVPEITVGRDPVCDCAFDDQTLSAHHARLVYRQEQWWVEDLGSTNGTFLNDQQVSIPTVLTNGDKIRFGIVTLKVLL